MQGKKETQGDYIKLGTEDRFIQYEVLNEGVIPEEKEELDIDEYLFRSGECGLYQVYLVCLMMFISFPLGYPPMVFYFIGYDPAWVYTKDLPANNLGFLNSTDVKVHPRDDHRRCRIDRSEWQYYYTKSSLTTDFDLVCDRSWLLAFSGSSFFIGWGIGSIIMGYLSDMYGRKTILIPALFLDLFCLFIHWFITSIYVVIAVRFIMGIFHAGPALNHFILVIELVGPTYRVLANNLSGFTWGLASIIMALHAYYIDDWRLLCVCLSAPYMVCVFLGFLFPESIRWLNLHDKNEQAERILKRAAEINGNPLPNVSLKQAIKDTGSDISYIDFFKTWKVAKIVLFQGTIWLSSGMSYYALAWAFADIGGDIYINFILASFTTIPMHALAIDFLQRFGRRKTASGSFLSAIFCCLAVAGLSFGEDLSVYRLIMALLGKCSVALAFMAMYMWSSEIYPTVVRTQGMGFNIITSRAGAAVSPFVKILDHVHPSLPFFLIAFTTIITFIFCLFLPETMGKPTRETFDDLTKNE